MPCFWNCCDRSNRLLLADKPRFVERMRQHSKATRASPKYVEPKQTKNLRDEIMCYQIEVLEYNEDKAIITVGESKFIAYHDTDVRVEEGFTDFWDFTNDSHYTRPNGKYEVDAMTRLNSLPTMNGTRNYTSRLKFLVARYSSTRRSFTRPYSSGPP